MVRARKILGQRRYTVGRVCVEAFSQIRTAGILLVPRAGDSTQIWVQCDEDAMAQPGHSAVLRVRVCSAKTVLGYEPTVLPVGKLRLPPSAGKVVTAVVWCHGCVGLDKKVYTP